MEDITDKINKIAQENEIEVWEALQQYIKYFG